MPLHPRIKFGAGSNPLPRRGEGICAIALPLWKPAYAGMAYVVANC